ncbi:MAG: helix-turn-helix domain-containing protein, partial [Parafannyhessea umbonata]|nr:helix-turn-helix domain-containing protein [Parafannyhessea umbonata]
YYIMNEDKLSMDQAKPSYWAVLPAAVRYDAKITAGAKLLYAEISSLTDQRGYCYASNAYFQALYGISEPTVQRYLRALKAGGYITIADGDGGSGRRKIFAGVNPMRTAEANPIKNDGVTPSKMTPNPLKNDTRIKKENRKEEQPPKAPQGAAWEPEMFERFWKAYPCKRDKASARREWDRLEPDRKLMKTMSAALARQKASEQWQREIGIPYACRWLRNRRWEDEIDDASAPAASAPTDDRRDLLWI